MAWSTRELAELAGATVNTVRHYHRLGLLEAPERRSNGYKQYGVTHLVRLLRIRRLVELGVPLSRIGQSWRHGDIAADLLRQVDSELEAEMARLAKARSEIAALLRDGAPADTPAGFESIATRLTSTDTSLLHVYSRLYDDSAMKDLRRMAETDDHAVNAELDALPEDADEATRQSLAERLAPSIARNLVEYPWLSDPSARLSRPEHVTQQTLLDAVGSVYHPAQVDVLTRASLLAGRQAGLTPPAE